MHQRPRRLRQSESVRSLVRENQLTPSDFIMPLFVMEKEGLDNISSMPGQFRLGPSALFAKIEELQKLGVHTICLFPVVEENAKSPLCEKAYDPSFFYNKLLREVKTRFSDVTVMTDVALDPYSSYGHDGVVDPNTMEILNDSTLELLSKMALVQADAGADIIGPSDMMDGRVARIRDDLELHGFHNTMIMSYTAKYASAFYGPFRDALDSAPKSGDKCSYQMDFHNSTEALKEAELDTVEGADFLMVKPGLAYLDIITRIKQHSLLPVAAYNVSGEYSMIKAAAQNGWIDEEKVVYETLIGFKRAGADIILTYFAEQAARFLDACR